MTTITAQDAFKSKQNFSEFMSDTPAFIVSTLAEYPKADGKVIIEFAELTQNFESFGRILSDPQLVNIQKPPFIVWTVANPKEEVLKQIELINKYSISDFGVFVFKADLNGDKMEFKCLLKPEIIKKQSRPVNTETPSKQLQKQIWKLYFEICDGSENPDMQIKEALPQHYQNISIQKAGIQILQTLNTKDNYVASEIAINNNKELYNKLFEHKAEIEKEVGEIEWYSKENVKSSKIKKTFPVDINNTKNHKKAVEQLIKMGAELKAIAHKYL